MRSGAWQKPAPRSSSTGDAQSSGSGEDAADSDAATSLDQQEALNSFVLRRSEDRDLLTLADALNVPPEARRTWRSSLGDNRRLCQLFRVDRAASRDVRTIYVVRQPRCR
jgi:hypothetical protein